MSVLVSRRYSWGQSKPPPFVSRINYDNPIARGLIGRWLFNEAPSLRLFDLLNNRSPMDFVGSSIGWSGYSKFDQSAAVNVGGTSQYISGAGNSPLNGLSAFTAVGWIRGVASNSHSFFSLWDNSTNQILIRQSGSGGPWSFFTFTTGQAGGNFTISPSVNLWAHSVFRYDGAEMSMWINGIKDATTFAQTGALQTNTVNPLRMTGNEGTFSSERWHFGGLDNVSLYNRALSVGEIQESYRNPFGDIELPSNVIISLGAGAASGALSSGGTNDTRFVGAAISAGNVSSDGVTNAQFEGADGAAVSSGAFSASGVTNAQFLSASQATGSLESGGQTNAQFAASAIASGALASSGVTNAQFFGALAGAINTGALSAGGVTNATFITGSEAGGALQSAGVTTITITTSSRATGDWTSSGITNAQFIGATVGGVQAADFNASGATNVQFVGDGGVPIVPVVPEPGTPPGGAASGWSSADGLRTRRRRLRQAQDEQDVRDIQELTAWIATEARFKRVA